MNYEIENAINKKVDNWEFHALSQKADRLESENRQLAEKLGRVESKLQNHYSAIEQLIQLIIDRELLPEDINTLHQIRQYL